MILLGLFALLAAGWYLLTATNGSQISVSSDNYGDNVTSENAPPITQHIDPSKPSTWPSGDRIWDVCRAIAYAEGYNVSGSVPAVLNNPGDISDGKSTYGSEHHSGSDVTKFPDAPTGWQWLYTKIQNAVTGQSHVYLPTMSWYDIGAKWAPPNADQWAENVASKLGVDPGDTFSDYILG